MRNQPRTREKLLVLLSLAFCFRHTKEEETEEESVLLARSLTLCLSLSLKTPARPPLSSPARSRTQQEQQNTERCHLPSAPSSASSLLQPRSPRNEDTQASLLLSFFSFFFFFLLTQLHLHSTAFRPVESVKVLVLYRDVAGKEARGRREGAREEGGGVGGGGAHLLRWFAAREAPRRESCALSGVRGEQNVWRRQLADEAHQQYVHLLDQRPVV